MSYGGRDHNSGGNRYRPPGTAGSGKAKSTKWIWITVASACGFCFLLCFGGIIGAVYLGLGMVSAEVQTELRDNPVIQEEIGEIEEFDMNFAKSANENDEEVFVFDVEGTKGNGEITTKIHTNMEGGEDVVWARLRTSAGKTIELELE